MIFYYIFLNFGEVEDKVSYIAKKGQEIIKRMAGSILLTLKLTEN